MKFETHQHVFILGIPVMDIDIRFLPSAVKDNMLWITMAVKTRKYRLRIQLFRLLSEICSWFNIELDMDVR